ncbi:hypothetical protein [Rhodopirellula bahusiensis]|uniref:Uncharacterized protein n=1 Tax=Rhodopirellula bahusiensis TaxID=2014065 RepID=A0A2G1VZT3_9BACT|nr:hypothetical protein [Rhodopirellula bahusiensis]PHQ32306.1 hypothetical protein CEE69_26545 [Rhodopirellula bahusiensis]
MSRLFFSALFAFSVSVFTVGCGGGGNEVLEDTRSPAEVQQEQDDYEKQMEDTASSATNS